MAPLRKRITVFGSLNLDLVSYVPHHPEPGETLTAKHFSSGPGGKGANQAMACGKLSRTAPSAAAAAAGQEQAVAVDVAMIGAVGSDAAADELRRSLEACSVDTTGVRSFAGLRTGVAIIVVDQPSGQNRIILSPEANHALRPTDVAAGLLLCPAPPDLLVLQLEMARETVLAALVAAHDSHVSVLLNPAPAQPLPASALAGLAHLVVNESEAALLADCRVADLDDVAGLRRVADLFLARGVAHVLVTLGARGVYYAAADGRRALVPACAVDVVDTTAAGDTFVGAYALAAVQAGDAAFDIDAAVRVAVRAAALTVSRKGTQASIPWKNELD